MMKRKVIDTEEKILTLFWIFETIPLKLLQTDFNKALKIAWKYKIYAYDAFYLEPALRLGLPLLTFDANMRRIGKELGIKIIEKYNENI
jgi:predicted nucleic acid-binding protein